MRESCNSILDRTQLALDSHAEFNDALQNFDEWMTVLEDKRTQAVTMERLKDRQIAIQVGVIDSLNFSKGVMSSAVSCLIERYIWKCVFQV